MSRAPDPPTSKYAVGYKRPPQKNRFQPGKSGNPNGRPKGVLGVTDLFRREAKRMVRIKSGDQVQKIPKDEALVRRLVDMALQGDLAAARMVLPHFFSAEGEDANFDAQPPALTDVEREAMEFLVSRLAPKEAGDD